MADRLTGSNTHQAMLAGASAPRLEIFRVDVGGPARILVGPVARGFEARTSLAKRGIDAAARKHMSAPTERSYAALAPRAPVLAVLELDTDSDHDPPIYHFAIRSPVGVRVRIDLLDHHREPIGSARAVAGAAWQVVRVTAHGDDLELVRVVVGAYSRELSHGFGSINIGLSGVLAVPDEQVYQLREKLGGSAPDRHQ